MNKKGKVAMEILMMMITIVVTSAIIFLLIQSGLISVRAENSDVSVLNAEFIPMGREGYLTIQDFNFCDFVDPGYNCIGESDSFPLGSQVHFLFVIESSTYNGDVMLVENYRIKGPNGELLLEVDEKNNFHYEISSDETKEQVTFKDFFVVGEELPEGEYTLELFIENPLLNKKTTLIKEFKMFYFEEDFFEEIDVY